MSVAYANGGGFAAVRSYKQRQQAEIARRKAAEATRELPADVRRLCTFRPVHSQKLEQHSREWFEACDRAFQDAMEAAGYQRRIGKTQVNAMGTTR